MLADRNIEDTTGTAYLRKGQMETNKQRHLSYLYNISLGTQMSHKILSSP